MKYPTIEEVENASHEQICRWWRFLPSPRHLAVNKSNDVFNEILLDEFKIQSLIGEKLKNYGGFTPELSKKIGWS